MSDATAISKSGTTALDYSEAYYQHYSDSDEPYAWSSPGWRSFFTHVASRIIATTGPADRVLDVGCAKGMLTQAFVAAGSQQAEGFDISQAAIDDADPDVSARLRVGSATSPIEGHYDLVTCIEVLEHMAPPDAAAAIDNICAVTDRAVISSTPGDFDEPTHVNVHPVADWAAEFAARGFFRRTDVDLSFLSPWAGYFERGNLTTRDVVHRYEGAMWPLREEVGVKRASLLDLHRQLSQAEDGETVAQLRHEILVLRDHAVGAEAEVGTARADLARAEAELHHLRAQLDTHARRLHDVLTSNRWKLSGRVMDPVAKVKRRVGR
ncbi:MAG: class I SAM-dependent methyltransferase [Actinomycetota bacterium]|nr:class I SAM-dependent methyltransferase [Actinomycetota bacterium]